MFNRIYLISTLLIFCSTAFAEQSYFDKNIDGDHVTLHYQWQDHSGKAQQISFGLDKVTIFDRYRNFGIYQPKSAQEYVLNALRKYIRKNPFPGIQVQLIESSDAINMQLSGRDQQLIDQTMLKLNKLEQQFTQDYLTERYYHYFETPDLVTAIKPDHNRIARESVDDLSHLKPIILEQSSIKNIRKVTNYVLSFVQSIPYATLESRVTSSGAGFNPPLKLLWENQGDCDSKVTLIAALLRTLMPRIKMALVFIDNHALIGIELEPKGEDIAITEGEITYVLAEPTGPALLALGSVAPDSEQAIFSGRYSAEPFHRQASDKKGPSKNEEPNLEEDSDNLEVTQESETN